MNRRGFTLLELLIVVGILAVLATVAVLVINPTEYLRQSRDAKRIADLMALNKAMSMAEFNSLAMGGAPTNIYVSLVDTVNTCANLGLPPLPATYRYWCVTNASNLRKVDGTGWIPVTLSTMAGGSPLATLPVDPVNDATKFYAYVPGGSFALSATLESEKYMTQSGVKDGGASPAKIEVGSDLQLLKNAEGLVGYWSFDEGAGTVAADTSGNGNNGAFVGAPTWVGGKVGKALSFDGVDDYVSVPHASELTVTTGNFSLAFWTVQYNPHPATYPRIMGKGTYNVDGWDITVDKNTNNATMRTYQAGANQWVSVGTMDSSAFTHVAITKTGTSIKTYINGVLASTGTVINPTSSASPLTFGVSHPGAPTEFSKGIIDEIYMYNRALSAEEIQAIYAATK